MKYKIILTQATEILHGAYRHYSIFLKCSDICTESHPWNIRYIFKGTSKGSRSTTVYSGQHSALQITTNGLLHSLLS